MDMTDPIDILTRHIAQTLGESEDEPQNSIRKLVTVLGIDQVQALLDATLATEATGGLMLPDGSRRRTPGGVFFYLARQRLSEPQRQAIFGTYWLRMRREHQKSEHAMMGAPAEPVAEIVEGTIAEIVRSLPQGEARTVKVTLIGRPGKVVQRQETVLMIMEGRKAPALPKGLPAPPHSTTLYTVYLTARHWRKVVDALKNPEDVLILEGWQAYDPELEGIAVWGMNVTTKLLQQKQREQRGTT